MYSNNSEWFLNNASSVRHERRYHCCDGLFPDVTFNITISRRSLFYLLNLIFPMTIIGMLTMCSFLLPAESGERISLAITLLLAMTVFMLVVADIIPATSDVIPLVGIFFNASMIEMVMMIVVLCYIMRLYHKDESDPPMPLWTRRFFLDWLSYVIRVRVQKANLEQTEILNIQNSILLKNHNGIMTYYKNANLSTILEKLNTSGRPVTEMQRLIGAVPYDSHISSSAARAFSSSGEGELLLMKMDVLVEKIQQLEELDRMKGEWVIVARTIDRCFLIFFVFVYMATVLACFFQAPNGYVS